ncbi:uncharacterized protein LAJ45_09265 [Morchella importuna]|uniref:uncharacterized protein n=1 Tax=Morchella importuna TaxID=1174673 RepID=UPI001E8D94BF|nr:uncharacterized protein LAJ45_09265 [Morchella importuna]KAH8146583.1 hypothetical protein LAJ45_09265 [Morchella importuna]
MRGRGQGDLNLLAFSITNFDTEEDKPTIFYQQSSEPSFLLANPGCLATHKEEAKARIIKGGLPFSPCRILPSLARCLERKLFDPLLEFTIPPPLSATFNDMSLIPDYF